MRVTNPGETRVRRRTLLLAGGAVGIFAVGGWWWRSRQAPDYDGQALSVTQAHERAVAGDIVLIDIRTPREWRQTGIGEGAQPIDMRRDDFLVALRSAAGPDPAAPTALICARGVRSARLSLQLSAAGYGNIIDVPEGMLGSRAGPGWLASGLPVQPYEKVSQ